MMSAEPMYFGLSEKDGLKLNDEEVFNGIGHIVTDGGVVCFRTVQDLTKSLRPDFSGVYSIYRLTVEKIGEATK